jgi:hypothetical protein
MAESTFARFGKLERDPGGPDVVSFLSQPGLIQKRLRDQFHLKEIRAMFPSIGISESRNNKLVRYTAVDGTVKYGYVLWFLAQWFLARGTNPSVSDSDSSSSSNRRDTYFWAYILSIKQIVTMSEPGFKGITYYEDKGENYDVVYVPISSISPIPVGVLRRYFGNVEESAHFSLFGAGEGNEEWHYILDPSIVIDSTTGTDRFWYQPPPGTAAAAYLPGKDWAAPEGKMKW